MQNFLWISSLICELSIAALVFYRRLWRSYPVFSIYALSEVLRTAVLMMIGNGPRHYATYFYVYWISEGIVSLIGFGVIAEIFRSAFSVKGTSRKWGVILFRCSLLGLVIIALLLVRGTQTGDANKLLATIFLVKRVESFVRLGVVAALFAFLFIFGLPWTEPIVGIAAGFAIYGAMEVAAIGVRSGYGHIAGKTSGLVLMVTNLCQKMLWASYLLRTHQPLLSPPAIGSPDPTNELAKMHSATRLLVER